jgi:hypothetical protein
MDGKKQENKDFGTITIKGNLVTCRHDGKEKSWKLDFGPHHMIRCTETIDGKTTTVQGEKVEAGKGMHTHHGVYVAGQDYFCVAMNKGLDHRTSSGTGNTREAQQRQPEFGQAAQGPREANFVLILRRSGTSK